jgi:hypothetical protein
MPGLKKARLMERLCAALTRSNCVVDKAELGTSQALYHGDSISRFRTPASAAITFIAGLWATAGAPLSCRVPYPGEAWNGQQLKFKNAASVLIGYYDYEQDKVGRELGNAPPPDMQIIAAWDAVRHIEAGLSSSCQITFSVLHQAYLTGCDSKTRRCAMGRWKQLWPSGPNTSRVIYI